jgi:pyruvate,orthophosphate dikinase
MNSMNAQTSVKIKEQRKSIYFFQEGNATMKDLLGGKGANLAEMTKLGLPIPPGFTITTEVCRDFIKSGGYLEQQLLNDIDSSVERLGTEMNAQFGSIEQPLLVSVRSGSLNSMPGMLDTILNLGLNDQTVASLAQWVKDERFAYDCYRRFIAMFGNIVLNVPHERFEDELKALKASIQKDSDQQLTSDDWKQLIEAYKKVIEQYGTESFPQDVYTQLHLAVKAVFRSWGNARAKVYRKLYGIPEDQGTAVNIQAMVFGNRGEDSATGVMFTRNPSTGSRQLYGEFLVNAQGEDVVAGIRTPSSIEEMSRLFPQAFADLANAAAILEEHYEDMQDIEFTIEQNRLYLLQTRVGKRTAQAAVKIAMDLLHEGQISPQQAISRIDMQHLNQLLHRTIKPSENLTALSSGLPASPGAATGVICLDADTVVHWAQEGRSVILLTEETSPEDIHGLEAAEGVLTAKGGMTSHAAVVARGMGKPCICGCGDLSINKETRTIQLGGLTLHEGDELTIDGNLGQIFTGLLPLTEPELSPELEELLKVADEIRHLKIYANADSPKDAAKARKLGAEGVGLCRTEHMFFSEKRLPIVQKMILADNREERTQWLTRLLPMQQADFEHIFEEMAGCSVTIRLLDPPLHEFLPNERLLERQLAELNQADVNQANVNQVDVNQEDVNEDAVKQRIAELECMLAKVRELRENNPMLGLRGCRLGIRFPEIYDMQLEAIFRAALSVLKKGIEVQPEIMVPLVGDSNELKWLRDMADEVAKQILGPDYLNVKFSVGTMIEVPRAALLAEDIAKYADFFSFGTNDLTQMTYGYSRDDAEGTFLKHYLDNGILASNPFQTLDSKGVGQLIEWAVQKGRTGKPKLKIGLCGEQGGDYNSISFCHKIGLNYVSCSPMRIPYARLAAAQVALAANEE